MIEVKESIFGHSITITAQKYGGDWSLGLTGGDTPHVGSVSMAWIENGAINVNSIISPGHMDYVAGERVAVSVAKATGRTVSISSGIHYDNLSKKQISDILTLTDRLSAELLVKIAATH